MMKTCKIAGVILAACAGLTTQAQALTCTTEDGQTELRMDPASIAIPANSPDGTVAWRSRPLGIPIACRRDGPGGEEEVVLHLNPDRRSPPSGLRIGLTLDGVDHHRQNGRLHTGARVPACTRADACPSVSFDLQVAAFVAKHGDAPFSGKLGEQADYRLFQAGGLSGSSPGPGGSLSYVFGNLSAVRFIACQANLRVIPQTLSFGEVAISGVSMGRVIDTRTFALETRRACDSPFSLDARFRPVTGSLDGDLLVPVRNPAVGIRLRSADDDQPLRFNEPFALSDLRSTDTARREFNAELLWRSVDPQPGPFSAEIMVDLFYR